jgi:hypothetical protein
MGILWLSSDVNDVDMNGQLLTHANTLASVHRVEQSLSEQCTQFMANVYPGMANLLPTWLRHLTTRAKSSYLENEPATIPIA